MYLFIVKVFDDVLPPALFEAPQTENSLEQIVQNYKILQFKGLPALHESWSCNLDNVDIG